MYKSVFGHGLGVVVVLVGLGLASCAGDDGGGSDPVPCSPNTPSVPGMDGDPCPQAVGAAPSCPGLGTTHMAVSMCQADGTWSLNCSCVPRNGVGATGSGGAAAPAAVCGNGVKEGTEQCDGTAPTCESMGMGAGMTMCTGCRIMMMCGTGGGMGGSGGS